MASRRARLTALAAATALAMVAAACGGDDEPAAAARVELISAGAVDGRVDLTPDPPLGSEHTVRTVAQRTVGFAGDQAPFDIEAPRAETTSRLEIIHRPLDGGFSAAGTVIDAQSLDSGELDAHNLIRFNRGIDAIPGAHVSASVDANGIVERSRLDLPDGLSPVVIGAVLDLGTFAEIAVVPVPVGDVGVGAIWVDTVVDSFRSLDTVTTTTYELTALDGDRYSLDVTYEQVFDGTTTEAGLDLTYSGTVTGGGTVEGDVSRPTPIARHLAADGTVSVSDGAETVEMLIDLFVDVSTS